MSARSTAFDINSPEYWDHRFSTDWQAKGGREQTEFFGRVALENMPGWLLSEIRSRRLSIVDFGCGEGQAAGLLKARFSDSRVAGVDVSATAIANARAQVSGVEFSAGDQHELPEDTDVLFCSNTIEHFTHPSDVMRSLFERAREYAIVLIPFREDPRDPEHFVSFDFDSVPVSVGGMSLAWYRVIDCAALEGTYWRGEQLLLVYGRPSSLEAAGVKLASLDAVAEELRSELLREKKKAADRVREVEAQLDWERDFHKRKQTTLLELERELRERLAAADRLLDETTRGLANYRSSRFYKLSRLGSVMRQPRLGQIPRALLWAGGFYRSAGTGLLGALGAPDPLDVVQEGMLRTQLALEGASPRPPAPTTDSRPPLLRRMVRTGWDQVADLPFGRAVKKAVPESFKRLARNALFAAKPAAPGGTLTAEAEYDAWVENIRRVASRPYDAKRFASARSEIEMRAAGAKGVVVYLPTIKWGYLFQRPQQIVRQLARQGYLCIFCTPYPTEDKVDGIREIEPNLYLCSDVRLALNLPGTVLWVNWPVNRAFGKHFGAVSVVYEYIDELEVFHLYCKRMQEDHDALVVSSDVVVASADRLHEQLLVQRPDAVLAPNGVDPDDFRPKQPLPVPADLAPVLARGKPIVGYYGALARWFDYDLMNDVSARAPDLSFVLIGPDYDGTASKLAHRENVFLLGPKSYQELAAYSTRFDVATVPFVINDITRSTSPVKLFEYMAAGAPIVTTPMDECRKYESVLVAGTAEEFVTALRKAAGMRTDSKYQELLAREAAQNTWAERVERILEVLEKTRSSREVT